jgi:thiol-disulfide isomerase/thioredoxin
MKSVKSFTWLFLLCCAIQSFAQNQHFKSLKIGDTVPDIEVKNIINYPATSLKISDFKDKLLILDFWATWCGPCLSSFPKLDSLQSKFGNKIKILPITSENKEKVVDFLQKMKTIKHFLPGTATEDSVLDRLFKHTFLPHYVWINNGNVIAVTGKDQVNENNIKKIIEKEQITLEVKDDFKRQILYPAGEDIPTFAPSITVKIEDETKFVRMPDSSLIFYSAITGYMEGLLRGYHVYYPDIFTARNLSISELYSEVLLKNSLKSLNRSPGSIIIDIKDTALLHHITPEGQNLRGLQFDDWIRRNGYCYDIKVPPEFVDKKFEIILGELNRYFGIVNGIEGVLEKRNSKYLALMRITNKDNLLSKGGRSNVEVDKFSLKIQNRKLYSLINALVQPLQLYPFIVDETNYKDPVDLVLNCELSNLEALNKELERYGLVLREKEKVFDVPIIRLKTN